ncbi:mesothelin isoform 1 preproprotein [Pimephales promelas]|nr:mesothelin isoform 1 preproprotein [Pimephales promelas]
MMNRTFIIIRSKIQEFEASVWVTWFTVKLIPILPSFTPEMLVTVTANISCTNYHVIVKGLGSVFHEMTLIRTQEITKVLVEHLKKFATQFSLPGCRQNIASDADWLKANLGPFTTLANYSDLKELNVSGVAALETLSPDQKAELLLDPSTGALENVTVVKEVLSSILKSPDENQLEKFFEKFVEVSKEENVTYITNVEVRDTMLNLTLTALAPKFPLFQTSDYELWFQINLVVLLASFRPSVLVVIPTNLTCDSYSAILKGLETALAVLPSGLKAELKSSVDQLVQSQGEDCTPPRPVGFCNETLVDENRLCQDVNRGQLEAQRLSENSSAGLCDFNISDYACSSVASSLSSDDIFTLLTCKVPSGTSTETWKLFFLKVAGVLEDALSKFSNMTLPNGQPQSHVLDAIGEVKVNNFSAAQLTDAGFVAAWFQDRLRPFLSAVSRDFLSCLSSKNFSCDTYQVVVQALGRQASLMAEEQKRAVFTQFIQRFLSRDDLKDPACLSKTTSSADWLEKNIGNFSSYADLEDLKSLNGNFSSLASLALLTPTQVAQLTLSSGVLNNTNQISAVFDRLEEGDAFQNVEEFLTALSAAPETPDITPAARDVMMNRTFIIIRSKIQEFEASVWVTWFTVKLIPILPSFTPEMLVTVTANISCTNYHVIVEGLSTVYSQMPAKRREEIAASLLLYLKQSVNQINQPACNQDIKNDTDWLDLNLGQFFTYVPYSDLAQFNISKEAVYGSLTDEQKVERILTPGLLEDESAVKEVFGSVVNSPDQNQLDDFFNKLISSSAQRNVSSINSAVSSVILNMTLMNLATRFQTFNPQTFALWFQTYLHLFLPGIGPDSLSVIPKTISCDSYREILKGCDEVYSSLTLTQSTSVYRFTRDYLSHQPSQGQSCVQSMSSDSDWLLKHFGRFRIFATFTELINLKRDFNGVAASLLLTVPQLSELCSAPSRLRGPQDVFTVMSAVETPQLSDFFDLLSPNIQVNELNYSAEVKQAFLQTVFGRAGLASPSLSDAQVSVWLSARLAPLLSALSSADVTRYFDIVRTRGCGVRQEAVRVLDSSRTALDDNTQLQIYYNIQQLLTDADPLSCYGNGSFYQFLKTSFLHFGFPDVNGLQSLIPVGRRPEVLSSISTAELSEFLQAPLALGDGSGLCDLLRQYERTAQYLEKEPLGSPVLAQQVLSCVWPRVLELEVQSEVDQWFESRLVQYLPLLTSQLIGPAQLSSAACLPFRKLVSVLGNNYNFSKTDFTPEDVYSSIKAYLTSGGSPRCYNASNPQLNSTNWLVSYIGIFISYVTLPDLNSFVSSNQIGVFLEDPENLQLLNSTAVQSSVMSYYITQLYNQNPTFNPVRLPGKILCGIPSFAYELLGSSDSLLLIERINIFCNGTESAEITAALAANLPSISSSTIQLLGSQSVSLTEGQISSASSDVIQSALPTLSTVDGWNQGQANAVIQTLIESNFPIDTGSSLLSLGTLVKGVPSETISSITSSELLGISRNPTFISNILSAPVILQLVYVMKIVSIDESKVLENVPDVLAGSIPRVLLVPQESVNVTLINNKRWTQEQAEVLFGSVASVSTDTEELSEALLQGFTCTSAQTLGEGKVKQLVRACRSRAGRQKVQLKESQLMCMHKYVKEEASSSFSDLPSEMLLYYSYEKVAKENCRSYFSAVGTADFSVLSSVLDKQTTLFNNARSCLGISGQSLSRDQVEVLGNLSCTLEPVYIQNSDPAIIERLKNCRDLSDAQISAVQTLLLSGNTTYGNSSVWDQQTLQRLDLLPLYFTDVFWQRFSASVKRMYMKGFMPFLRTRNTEKPKLKRLFKNCNAELDVKTRIRRSAVCTAGNITEAIIADASFPFGYTSAQLDACLDPRVLRDNLAAVAEKVDDDDFQRVLLNKLKQVFPGGLTDSVLKLLASVSRQATVDEIRTWSVNSIDTLNALMDKSNGQWDRNKSVEVILRYLSVPGHTLGTNELNVIGSNLCSLNVSTLQSITAGDLGNANVLDLSLCSYEQKSVLYITANSSLRAQHTSGRINYLLISPYLGGAPVEDVRALASYNITMDISTFRSLSPAVLKSLSVSDVRALMGSAVEDLKVFENDSVVQVWISSQPQSQLDTLNLGLRGGRSDPSTSSAPVSGLTNSSGTQSQPTLSQSAPVTVQGSAAALCLAPGVLFMASCVWFLTLT